MLLPKPGIRNPFPLNKIKGWSIVTFLNMVFPSQFFCHAHTCFEQLMQFNKIFLVENLSCQQLKLNMEIIMKKCLLTFHMHFSQVFIFVCYLISLRLAWCLNVMTIGQPGVTTCSACKDLNRSMSNERSLSCFLADIYKPTTNLPSKLLKRKQDNVSVVCTVRLKF